MDVVALPKTRVALLRLLARCVWIWSSTRSLTVTGLYLLAALALRHPRIRAAPRWLPAAPLIQLALSLLGFELPEPWTGVVHALAQIRQLVPARVTEPRQELVACPACRETGRNPEAPAAISGSSLSTTAAGPPG